MRTQPGCTSDEAQERLHEARATGFNWLARLSYGAAKHAGVWGLAGRQLTIPAARLFATSLSLSRDSAFLEFHGFLLSGFLLG